MKFVNKTYYQLLEVEPTATLDQLRRAWRQVRTTWQPGSIAIYSIYSPEEAAAIRHLIEEAWSVLSDPERRALYDRYLTLLSQGPTVVRSPEAFWDTVHGVSRAEAGSSRVDEALLPPRSSPEVVSAPLYSEEASRSLDEISRKAGAERSEIVVGSVAPHGVEREVRTATSPQGIERSIANRLEGDHSTPIGKTGRSKAAGVSMPKANLPAAKPGDEKARLSGVKAVPPSVAASLSTPPQPLPPQRTLQPPQPPRAPIPPPGQKNTVVWKESADGIRTATSNAPRPLPHSPHVRPARDPFAPGPAAPAARPRETAPALSSPLPGVAAKAQSQRVLESTEVQAQSSEIPQRLRAMGRAWRSTPLNSTAWSDPEDEGQDAARAEVRAHPADATARPSAAGARGTPQAAAPVAADSRGYDSQEYDSRAYDSRSYDSRSYDSRGYDSQAADSQRYDSQEYDSRALDSRDLSSTDLDARAVDSQRYDSQGRDSQGMDSQAYSSELYDSAAVDSTALDSTALDSTALDSTALDSTALDSTALDSTALDSTELPLKPPPGTLKPQPVREGGYGTPAVVARGTASGLKESQPLVTQVAAVWHPGPGDDNLEELPTSSSLQAGAPAAPAVASPAGPPGAERTAPAGRPPEVMESTEWELPPRIERPVASTAPRLKPGTVPSPQGLTGGASVSTAAARSALQLPPAPAKLEASDGEVQRWINQPTDPALRVKPVGQGGLSSGGSSTMSRAGVPGQGGSGGVGGSPVAYSSGAVPTPGTTPAGLSPSPLTPSPLSPSVAGPMPLNPGASAGTTGGVAPRALGGPASGTGAASETPRPGARPTDPTSISSGTMGGWSRSMATALKPTRTLPELEVSKATLAELEERLGMGGAYLKAVREAKGITLADIAERTKIQTTYLKYLEEERFTELPPAVYVEGFINQVSRLLKLDVKRTVAGYMQQYQQRTRARRGSDA